MLRVAFFGVGGRFSCQPLEAVAARHQVVAVVQSGPRSPNPIIGAIRRLRTATRQLMGRRSQLGRLTARLGVPLLRTAGRNDSRIARYLQRYQPDLICISGYQWVLPASVYAIPRLGAINVHDSLLPRHRGPMPLFWLYFYDDREAGVTVHWVVDQPDAGDIIEQEAFPLDRGRNIESVHRQSSDVAARLLTNAVDAIENGSARRIPQDAGRASSAPTVKRGTRMVRFAEWDVERVWHFLAGLIPHFEEPFSDQQGRPAGYHSVLGYTRMSHSETLGSVRRDGDRCEVFCRGGVVHLAPREPQA